MKETTKKQLHPVNAFNPEMLKKIIKDGYKFVKIRGYTHDRRLDYTNPSYMVLIPTKEISPNGMDLEVYEPVGSATLHAWAEETTGVKILVAFGI